MQKMTLTVKEMAELVGVLLPQAYKLTERSDFPLVRIGRKKLIPVDELKRWMENEAYRTNEEHV